MKVLARKGPWLRVEAPDVGEVYIGVSSVSQKKGRFVALELPVQSGPSIPACAAPVRPNTGKVAAQVVYSPEPEYT